MSHNSTVPSQLPLASVCPSELKRTLSTEDVCPVSVLLCSPVAASHRRIVLSELPLTSICPSGLKHRVLTLSGCHLIVCFSCPVLVSHRWIVPSALPVPLASVFPSGLKATLKIEFLCPVTIFLFSPMSMFHR